MAKNDKAKFQQWTKQIKDWETSGLTQRAYCARESLKHSTFDYWRRQIGLAPVVARPVSKVRETKRLTLVPVRVSAKRPAENLVVRSPAGWQYEFSTAIDSAWLAKFLRQMP